MITTLNYHDICNIETKGRSGYTTITIYEKEKYSGVVLWIKPREHQKLIEDLIKIINEIRKIDGEIKKDFITGGAV